MSGWGLILRASHPVNRFDLAEEDAPSWRSAKQRSNGARLQPAASQGVEERGEDAPGGDMAPSCQVHQDDATVQPGEAQEPCEHGRGVFVEAAVLVLDPIV